MSESLLFIFSLIDTGAVLFLLVYFWTQPKLIAHGLLIPLFLIYGYYYLALANVLPVSWMAYEYFNVPSGNVGVYDPTEIHGRGQLKRYMRNCIILVGWYLLSFFIYLYCLIISVLKHNPLEKGDQNLPDF